MKNCLFRWLSVSLLALPVAISAVQATATDMRNEPRQEPGKITDKRTRTPAQQKIDSQLLTAARSEGHILANTGTDVVYDSAGRAAVDISGEVTSNLLGAIRQEGGEVVNSYPQFKSVRAYLKLSSLETIAGLSEVRIISRAAKGELFAAKPAQETRYQSQSKPKNVKRSRTRRKNRRRHRNQHLSVVEKTDHVSPYDFVSVAVPPKPNAD